MISAVVPQKIVHTPYGVLIPVHIISLLKYVYSYIHNLFSNICTSNRSFHELPRFRTELVRSSPPHITANYLHGGGGAGGGGRSRSIFPHWIVLHPVLCQPVRVGTIWYLSSCSTCVHEYSRPFTSEIISSFTLTYVSQTWNLQRNSSHWWHV